MSPVLVLFNECVCKAVQTYIHFQRKNGVNKKLSANKAIGPLRR